ncbi:probable alpha-1,2-mannosidase family protein [Phialocephala subalpina]|uniref:Probable alpha-1,2-mannosidase family protein n=1 Tax=Phialocephala subalpina TaxID=576137 RepID=A0A1L7WG10_9HELO|nr:probable alpha-1,2-mannosidase family protein [Phialocephala subalpina]
MARSRGFSLLLVAAAIGSAVSQNSTNGTYDVLDYVDQLIGSSNGGNIFPGATLPYGMAKAVADTDSGSNQGGFTTDGSNITGFSSMHDSGTGGSPSLGNFALFPYSACPGDDVDGCVYPKKSRKTQFVTSSVKATPGYFGLELASGIQVDMTTTQHTSLFRFNFPKMEAVGNASSPLILMDLTDLSDSRQDNGSISVDAETGRMTGNARFLPSFGSGNYIAYFCADFSGSPIRDNGIFVNSRASADVKDLKISRSINGYPLPGGAFVRFESPGDNALLARVGVSLISSDQACSSAEKEIPSFDFEATHTAAETEWRNKISPIVVNRSGVNDSMLKNFYSGIYRTMVNPQDYTGENPLWESDEPYFDSFYCIWDLFRSQMPFLTVLDPSTVTKQIRSLIDTYVHEGWLPDCRMSLCKGFTQGGSNADNVLGDAYLKGLSDGIDWDLGYEAVINDAENEPYDWSGEGRGGLDSWKSLGYIPVQDFDYKGFGTMTRSVSRTLEYAYNDFVITQIASGLGKQGDVEKYTNRAGNWKNLYKSDQTSFNNGVDTGFTGFFQPRYLNKTFGFQDPLKCSNIDTNPNSVCSLQNTGAETFESSIWEYSFFVPHDQATLITTFGGPAAFVERLDYLHDQDITYIGNEPAFLTVYQYHYAGRPALSAKRSHFYIPTFFQPTDDGLPGNDDSGAMGSFVAFSMMGLFPNPGQNVYLIIPPFFESVSVTSPLTGKTATIRNVNFDPSYQNIYIQSATLDGEPYTKNWIDHSFFTEGKELVLTLGSSESAWGTKVEDLPPSLGTYEGFGNFSINGTKSALRERAVRFAGADLSEGMSAKTGGAYWAESEG